MMNFISLLWNYIFNTEVSPLRNIEDISIRHYVFQVLGFMWAVAFSTAIGSYTFLAASIIGHTVLIGAVTITAVVYTAAAKNPRIFTAGAGRAQAGEHE